MDNGLQRRETNNRERSSEVVGVVLRSKGGLNYSQEQWEWTKKDRFKNVHRKNPQNLEPDWIAKVRKLNYEISPCSIDCIMMLSITV